MNKHLPDKKKQESKKGGEPSITPRRLRITRDGILFLSGLLGIGHETAIAHTDRPTLLLLFAAMIGLPAFLRKDEKEQAKEDQSEGGTPP